MIWNVAWGWGYYNYKNCSEYLSSVSSSCIYLEGDIKYFYPCFPLYGEWYMTRPPNCISISTRYIKPPPPLPPKQPEKVVGVACRAASPNSELFKNYLSIFIFCSFIIFVIVKNLKNNILLKFGSNILHYNWTWCKSYRFHSIMQLQNRTDSCSSVYDSSFFPFQFSASTNGQGT